MIPLFLPPSHILCTGRLHMIPLYQHSTCLSTCKYYHFHFHFHFMCLTMLLDIRQKSFGFIDVFILYWIRVLYVVYVNKVHSEHLTDYE